MQTQEYIEWLAEERLREAQCLFESGFYDGAYYLGGYAVELFLKARICRVFNRPDFFMFKELRPEAYKPFRSHDYRQLLMFSGLDAEFNYMRRTDEVFNETWSEVEKWTEVIRYVSGKEEEEVKRFLIATTQFIKWIKEQL